MTELNTGPGDAANKRQIILDALKGGATFDDAHSLAGLSDYGADKSQYLMRLAANGYVALTVTDPNK